MNSVGDPTTDILFVYRTCLYHMRTEGVKPESVHILRKSVDKLLPTLFTQRHFFLEGTHVTREQLYETYTQYITWCERNYFFVLNCCLYDVQTVKISTIPKVIPYNKAYKAPLS